MLDKFAKLEEKMNQGMVKLGELSLKLYLLIAPKPVIAFFKSIGNSIRKGLFFIKAVLTSAFINTGLFLGEAEGWIVYKKNRMLDLKKKIATIFTNVKMFLLSTPIKSTKDYISNKTSSVNKKISNKLNKSMASQSIVAGCAFIMICLGFYGVYISSSKIINQEYPDRKPASVATYDDKPDYYYYKDQTLKVQNIKVPLHVLRAGKMDSLTIDFSVRTSTRFARYYLSENEHKLKDYFFTTVEPTVSDFALEEDGKEVLKEKIQREVQNFLDKERVEGTVLEVNILYIVGS